MAVFGKLEGILLVAMVLRHESAIFDLVILHPLLINSLFVYLSRNDRRSDVVFLPKSQAHLFEDELDLLPLRKGAVSFDMHVL